MALISRRRSAAATEDAAATENPQLDLGLQTSELATSPQESFEEAVVEKPVKVVRRRRVAVKAESSEESTNENSSFRASFL